MKFTRKNLANLLQQANWAALKAVGRCEYRITLRDEDELFVTEWLINDQSYTPGDQYLYTCSYDDLNVSPATEQHAFKEHIPDIAEEIMRDMQATEKYYI